MRIELNYQANSLDEAICQAIAAYLGKGMPRVKLSINSSKGALYGILATTHWRTSCKDWPTWPSRCVAIALEVGLAKASCAAFHRWAVCEKERADASCGEV